MYGIGVKGVRVSGIRARVRVRVGIEMYKLISISKYFTKIFHIYMCIYVYMYIYIYTNMNI
jgi:hypothetical protein